METFQAYHSMPVPMECGHSTGIMSKAGELWRTREILSEKHKAVKSITSYPQPSLSIYRLNCKFWVNFRSRSNGSQNLVTNNYSCILQMYSSTLDTHTPKWKERLSKFRLLHLNSKLEMTFCFFPLSLTLGE